MYYKQTKAVVSATLAGIESIQSAFFLQRLVAEHTGLDLKRHSLFWMAS